MTCEETPQYRKGDAFSLSVSLVDADNEPLVLDPNDLVAQVYNGDVMLTELAVTAGDVSGDYVLAATPDSSAWPEEVTVNIFDTSDSTSSDAIDIKVLRRISRLIVSEL